MPPIRWDPFRDLLSLQERMNKLFEDSLVRSTSQLGDASEGAWTPVVDILEKDDAIILKAELPGVRLEDVDLQIKDDVLILKGERKFEKETKKENYHRIERSYGTFSRSFTLPGIVDQSGISAKLKDGILEVKLPKARSMESKPIPIEIKK
ncbi:MAG TPA: Hsp20/alpha crystallin family protein [Nitrospiria bacterium]|nr:Hsp20/alpha crystallin family protein [Nitrospiria bacterium]